MHFPVFGRCMVILATGLLLKPLEAMAANPVNTVNNGPIVSAGTYFNTPGNKTTFTNTANGGLWLKSGSNLRGVEVSAQGVLSNNGGTLHFYAPGQVVRLDGNIDVRAIRDSFLNYQGYGGKVFVDSAYLYQSGNIYANGINGGLVQFNVGSATLAGNARIEAKGLSTGNTDGVGGNIAINASGAVDFGRQTVLDSSGRVFGTIDTNIINIDGGLVNAGGILRANGVESRGGTIRVVGVGQTDLSQSRQAISKAVTAGNLTHTEAADINQRLTQLKADHDGDIVLPSDPASTRQPVMVAIGSSGVPSNWFPFGNFGNEPGNPEGRAGDGGTIILTAARDIENQGRILAHGGTGESPSPSEFQFTDGGQGGTVSLNAGRSIRNDGRISASGGEGGSDAELGFGPNGGQGGLIAFAYGDRIRNSGVIEAAGGRGGAGSGPEGINRGRPGDGGLVVFSGLQNLTGSGVVTTLSGFEPFMGGDPPPAALGSIVAPDPAHSSNQLFGIWRKTQPIELLAHHENILLLRNSKPTPRLIPPNAYLHDSLTTNSYNAQVRTVQHQAGEGPGVQGGPAETEFLSKLVKVGESTDGRYLARNLVFTNTTKEHVYFYPSGINRASQEYSLEPKALNTVTVLSAGNLDISGVDFGNGPGGGHFSSISPFLAGGVETAHSDGLTGGSINIAGDHLLVATDSQEQPFHGGSTILKSTGRVNYRGERNGATIGGTQQFFAGTVFGEAGSYPVSSNGGISGGSILIQAPQRILGFMQATGGQYGGVVRLQSNERPIITGPLDVSGGIQDGQVIVEPVP